MATGDRFLPSGQDELAPAGQVGRINANLAAIRTLRVLEDERRPAAPGEQAILARWSGWGAVPQIFDERKDQFADHRQQLRALLTDDEYAAARRTTLNAHYTDAAIVRATWDGVRALGFDGGVVLEPGCGSGNFIGFSPPSARMLGIELDPVTAGIAAALYPDAEIRAESFADTRVKDGGFDLVIGNVPFSNAILTDATHNFARHSMHNHFIIKSLAAVRPGGLVAVLTSRYTMDAISDTARGAMADRADLVTAIRLPSGAHRRAAGTDAVTDLIVLRRREDGRPPFGPAWMDSNPREFEGGTAQVSEYFTAHPENVLGDLVVAGGQYSGEELTVRPHDLARLPDELSDRLAMAAADAHENGLAAAPRASWHKTADVRAGGGRVSLRIPARDTSRFEGTITAHPDGTFSVLRDGESEPWPCPDSQAGELRALLRLRDTVCSLLDAERASAADTPQLGELRARLNREYDAFVSAYGPLNRMSWRRTGRTDENGNETWARQAPAQGKFRQDPYAATVYALEDFDPETQTASKAPIFTRRVIKDRQPAESAESPADAIAICMDADGHVDIKRAAALLGSASQEEARAALGEHVYDEPGTGRLIPSAEYLSGKVRSKLTAAEDAAKTDPRFAVNVAALRKVLPADLTPGEIDARLGASWIPPEFVQQGLREILEDRTLTAVKGFGTSWQVKGNTHSITARDMYGTADRDAIDLAQHVLEQRPIKVSYSMDDLTAAEKRQLESARDKDQMAAFIRARAAAATIAARAKADELSDRFAEWLWEDPKRTATLVRTYNDKFNSLVLRSYDDARPRLPGLAEWFKPHPHQYAAVARIINEPAALLAHEVGAGKTAEMAMGCMELRRLGLASKPAIVVPNHMLEQFQREFLQLYPQAQVLACGMKDLQKDRRHAFVARIATGDWDAVIMSRSVFERIPMSAAEQKRYINAKLYAYDAWLEKAAKESEDTRMLKRMEKQRLSFEERLKRKLSRGRDGGITWEQTGIKYLFVDEAHGYKNRDTRSNSPALDIDGSGRAADLEMKLDYLRRENGQRIVTFATATPIANSMTEAYVMLSYLRPDLLTDAGIEDFDGWAGSFASTVSDVEVAPEGGIRVKERVARFRNLPELLLMWRVVADVKTGEDLKQYLKVPELAGGKPEVVTVPPSQWLRGFMGKLAGRADDVRMNKVKPKEDNMLKISSDGRAAALDQRLVSFGSPEEVTKLDVAADRIAQIYQDTRDSTYVDRDGNPESVRGSLQIVFCELGTPTGSARWGVYEYLKSQLSDRGIPVDQVRFMHEARNDREKANLFAAARAGKVSVLIGTTELMGVGTNVQKRAVALHHLDCPWRPADVAQREGRIIRQGNQNPRVRIIRYVTEGSFDAYMWQTVTRKAKFIAQVMHGRLDSREIEDIGGSESLSYSEVTALATGDMRILAKAKADAEVQRLSKLETSWKRTKRHLKTRILDGEHDIPRLEDKAARLRAAIDRRTEMKGDAFHCELGGEHITKRTDAADALQAALAPVYQRAEIRRREGRDSMIGAPIGTFGGFDLEAKVGIDSFGVFADLRFPDIPKSSIRVRPTDPKLGIVTKLENKLSGQDSDLAETLQEIEDIKAEVARARESLDAPFAKAAELARARVEADDLAAELGGARPVSRDPEAHETPVADAEEARDPDEDEDDAETVSWAASDPEADLDEDPLEDAGTIDDTPDDEWETEPAATADLATEQPAPVAASPAPEQPPEPQPQPQATSAAAPELPEVPAPPDVSEAPAQASVKPALPSASAPAEEPPTGTEPVAEHRGWAGQLRPERLLYADGTQLTARGQGEDANETWQGTAAGCVAAPEGSDYGTGLLQVVRWESGEFGIVHPALAWPRGTDPLAGLSGADRARWETFDRYEADGNPIAYLPAGLVIAGDVLQVERGPQSRVMDLLEVVSIRSDGAAGFDIRVRGRSTPLRYSGLNLTGVAIPDEHPTLAAAIAAATGRTQEPQRPTRDDATASEQAPSAASPSTSAAPSTQGVIRIEHDEEGTRVYGTDKTQTHIIDALKSEKFKWSRRQGFWYLPRPWSELTRGHHVRRLVSKLNELGVTHEVPQPEQETVPAPTEQEVQPVAADTPASSADTVSTPEQLPDRAPSASSAAVSPEVSSEVENTPVASTIAPLGPSDFEQESLFGIPGKEDNTAPATSKAGSPGSSSTADTGQRPRKGPTARGEDRAGSPAEPDQDADPHETPHSQTTPEATESEGKGTDAAPRTSEVRQEQPMAIANLNDIPVDAKPYRAGRHQAESGSRIIESDYMAWTAAHAQQDDSRLPDEHPRVHQLIVRWRAVRTKGIADGPGPAAARYHALAHAALSLAAATDGESRPREVAALNQLATHSRKFSARLRATAEHVFAASDGAGRYRGGRQQAERGSRIVEQDYRAWSRTGAPTEAARDLKLWEEARRTELAWHAIRRAGLHDGPGLAAARYRELAEATQALADGFTGNLPSAALLPLLQLTDHARKHSIRLEATEQAKTTPDRAATSQNAHQNGNGRPPGGDAYGTLPQELASVTRNAHAADHRRPDRQNGQAADQTGRRDAAFARQNTQHERD